MTSWARATRFVLPVICFGIFTTVVSARANELKQDTLQGWLNYVQSVEAKAQDPVEGQRRFLQVDGLLDQAEQARSGLPVIRGVGPYKVPHGLIHDWTGTIFIPSVTVGLVAQVLADYDRYQDFYQPLVATSSLLERSPVHDVATFTMVQRAFSVTAAVRIQNEIRTICVNSDRMYTISKSVRVQEISNYGRSDEHLLQEGRGPGFVWRTFTITRLEQRDGGVFVEMEMLELSRGIPFEFSWLIVPLTERLPRKIMNTMLANTKAAVEREALSLSRELPPRLLRLPEACDRAACRLPQNHSERPTCR